MAFLTICAQAGIKLKIVHSVGFLRRYRAFLLIIYNQLRAEWHSSWLYNLQFFAFMLCCITYASKQFHYSPRTVTGTKSLVGTSIWTSPYIYKGPKRHNQRINFKMYFFYLLKIKSGYYYILKSQKYNNLKVNFIFQILDSKTKKNFSYKLFKKSLNKIVFYILFFIL
jgi:hypothetical protein